MLYVDISDKTMACTIIVIRIYPQFELRVPIAVFFFFFFAHMQTDHVCRFYCILRPTIVFDILNYIT